MLYFTLLVFLVSVVETDGQDCGENWTYFNGKCYGVGDTPVSWTEAATICSIAGGNLVDVETAEENEYLTSLFSNDTSSERIWLGGSDIFNEGNWVWVSTRTHIFPYQNWHSNQPSDSGTSGEDCLSMYSGYKFEWDDQQCSKEFKFVCERKSDGDVFSIF